MDQPIYGIDQDNRDTAGANLTPAKRRTGFAAEDVEFKTLNQLLFEVHRDHVLGSASQLTANDCTMKQSGSGFVDKDGAAVTISAGDRIEIVGSDALSADLVFSADRLHIFTKSAAEIDINGNFVKVTGSKCKCEFYTDQDFDDGLEAETAENQRVIKNQGARNQIWLNNRQIFRGYFPLEYMSPKQIRDPYALLQNGFSYDGVLQAGTNDDNCFFRDLWDFYGGNETLELGPAFNPMTTTTSWYKVYLDDVSGRFFRAGHGIGGSAAQDPDVHTRASPMDAATISTYTSSASAEISGISDADIKGCRVGARVRSADNNIPYYGDTPPVTTIIGAIVHNSTDDNSIFLIDSEAGTAVSVSATGDLSIDMGGNSGISTQADALKSQSITIYKYDNAGANELPINIAATSDTSNAPLACYVAGTDNRRHSGYYDGFEKNVYAKLVDADETRVRSTQRFSYILP
ncbi:hypothetical protein KKI24_14295 [bacterium]|nr:hypothetical protein [bacterium]